MEAINDYKLAKFQKLINNVYKLLSYPYVGNIAPTKVSFVLDTVYDSSDLNILGNTILNSDLFTIDYFTYKCIRSKTGIDKIRAVADCFDNNYGIPSDSCGFHRNKYYFIFWALFILAVDDTDKEKHLSDICDIARIFDIPDDEVLDIANVVKYVIRDKTYQSHRQYSIRLNNAFYKVLKMYS